MNKQTESIIRDILLFEFGNDVQDENIWIESQDKIIPETDELFLTIGLADAQPVYTNSYFDDENDEEVQTLVQYENINISIFSSDDKAIKNRYRILLALSSIASQQQQEENNFRIFRIPTSFINTTETEGAKRLNKFTITVRCQVWYRITKTTVQEGYGQYFDTFATELVFEDEEYNFNAENNPDI